MSDFDVIMPDWDEIWQHEISAAVERELRHQMEMGFKRALKSTAWTDRTGALRRSGSFGIEGSFLSGKLEGFIRFDAPHALYVEEGTKPHVIRAHNREFLHWIGPARLGRASNGRFVNVPGGDRFARQVNHPGTEATHFLRDSIDRDKIEKKIASAAERAVRGWA